MTPQARVQAAIELLDEIIAAARGNGAAADTLIVRYFKTRRYAGSKDRRAVRDLVYRAIRRAGECPASGRAAMVGLAHDDCGLAAQFDGSPHAPAPIADGEADAEAGIAPAWLMEKLGASIPVGEMPALMTRAPLDVRVNRLKCSRDALVPAIAGAEPTSLSPDGLRLPEGFPVEQSVQWAEGAIEVQDEGSQLAVLASAASPGMTVIDLCAGGGGKTLGLAALMDNKGEIIACDVDRGRLSRLEPRAARAGVTIARTRLLHPQGETGALADLAGKADIVFVDAPCSGSGTWRRNPETRWRLTPQGLDRLTALQKRLLDVAAGLVRPGGVLIYVVCSLLAEEGPRQIDTFLAGHAGWRADLANLPAGQQAGQGVMLTPARNGTDGFFIARLLAP